jgi:hypothetical protein
MLIDDERPEHALARAGLAVAVVPFATAADAERVAVVDPVGPFFRPEELR